jgi:beta-ureidopropionase
MDELHKTLREHLPADVAKEVHRVLYGTTASRELEISEEARKLSEKDDFDLQAYAVEASEEQTRPRRLVRIGAIQNKIVLPTTDPIVKQV